MIKGTTQCEQGIAAARAASADARVEQRTSNITVIIPAFNEELNLPHALESVMDWADDVFVVDSESTDRTRDIAQERGASVVVQSWLGYAAQKNWALDNLPIETDWVFILDSDESITPPLRDELLGIASQPIDMVPQAGFYVNRLTHFMGSAIRHAGFFPSYNLRFFKRGKARYEQREVHEHMVVDGVSGRLRHLMHHEDRRGLEHFIAKHNRYSTLEAREISRDRHRAQGELAQSLERGIALRRWLKRRILPRLPFTGLWRFVYMYIIRLGFLDGAAGFRFCLVLSTYDFFISLKLTELRVAQRDASSLSTEVPAGLAQPEGTIRSDLVPSDLSKPQQDSNRLDGSTSIADRGATSEEISRAASADAAPVVEPRRVPKPEAESPAHALNERLDPKRMPPGDWPAVDSVPVSVLIPVKNEQRNIEECLRRLQWCSERVVVDSQSTDDTISLSQAMRADVYQFHYSPEGWPKKKNWALENVHWKNEWVLILDADEYMTPELAREIEEVVTGTWQSDDPRRAGCGDGFWINRRFMFMGRWLKGCGFYPSYNVRLLKNKIGRYERIGDLGDTGSGDNEVHEHIILSTGEPGYLHNEFLHFAYPDLTAWIEKHNRYTTWEAHAMEAKDEGEIRASLFGGPIQRRRWIKRYARRLMFRPTIRFIWSYVFQRGFRDGYPGLVMCRLLAWYEFVSIAKHREMKRTGVTLRGRP